MVKDAGVVYTNSLLCRTPVSNQQRNGTTDIRPRPRKPPRDAPPSHEDRGPANQPRQGAPGLRRAAIILLKVSDQ